MYYLQSRYYDPEIVRFINADALASTGQGMLGSNMFAYCGNEPVNRSDSNGELYTPGQIHDFVLEDICNRDSSKEYKDTYMRYKYEIFRSKWYSYGFCDLYDTVTHEIWELKRINSGPTCTFLAAFIQVGYYVEEGEFVHRPEKNYYRGGTFSEIPANVFTKPDNDGEGYYVIGYYDVGGGVIFYDYMYVPSLYEAELAAFAIAGIIMLVGTDGAAAPALGPAFATAFAH